MPVKENNYPGIFYQMRQPIVKAAGESLETGEVLVRLADSLGLIPELPDSLYKAKGDRMKFGAELMAYAQSDPGVMRFLPLVIADTLGQSMGSVHLAALWWNLFTSPKHIISNALRGGFKPGPNLVEELFHAVISHPEGLWVGHSDPENNLAVVRTQDGRINLVIPEMADWIKSINPDSEAKELKPDKDYPFILMAGRHMDMNANTQMRDPAWNKGRRACILAMSPEDAELLGFTDGQMVRVTTEAGEVEIELEITGSARPGQVIIPHGFGLDYNSQVYGINVNRLTKNTHRDKVAGTPLHRYVPCRVEGL
jgi:anaerobic selenocysteine-containing dehydrogenase